ncbi:MAG: ATP-grasp domain-containing protein [Bacteroidota bacterium]
MKKLLLLGGLRYLIPVIESAHELGYYVITCDYLPDNIAHKYSDKYFNANITDKEAILKLAKKQKVDGIMSFAVDPGVTTAAYVCEKLNLPSCGPYKSVEILQNKALFREFLADNNFNVPKAKGYLEIEDALADASFFKWPIIVKPVDAAGSKGVSKVLNVNAFENSIKNAISYSPTKQFIVEEFIEQSGFPSDSDSLSIDGELVFFTLSNQRFDSNAANPYTPAGFSWPSNMALKHQEELRNEVQRLLSLLKMQTSVYNIEARVSTDNKVYIMEVAPRGGGNRLAEMVKLASGIDLILYAVKAAVGEKINLTEKPNYIDYWGEIILHSDKEGYFNRLFIDEEIKHLIYEIDLWIKEGSFIKSFTGANETIGTIIIRGKNQQQIDEIIANYKKWIKIFVNY